MKKNGCGQGEGRAYSCNLHVLLYGRYMFLFQSYYNDINTCYSLSIADNMEEARINFHLFTHTDTGSMNKDAILSFITFLTRVYSSFSL